ncbi:MAG TPA: LptA/OstA family protein [Woeseiaceae bacterium]|nr:LptA/OstA family protein [Woeseiaceae bacterium]
MPISVDADSADYDGKTSMVMYRGLKLTQGDIGVQADTGHASNLDFENSVWHFSGNVIMDARNGHIESDTADLAFRGQQLQTARITGSPATFELERPGSDAVTHAEARELVYDFTKGVVEFSGDATITERGNRISSEYLVYNIEEQRIKAQSTGEGKVRIKYTPNESGERERKQNPPAEDEGRSPDHPAGHR